MGRRSARGRGRAVALVGGLALGSASGCNDIVPLECDAPAVTAACATGESGEGSSDVGEGTSSTSATGSAASTATSDATSGTDATGPADTGSFCGDGIVDGDEECDDADHVDIDECSNECRRPVCGNGIVQVGEDCDLGEANDDHGTCKSDCSAAICGDGVVRTGYEMCDGADSGKYTCEAFGYPGGEIGCDRTCHPDTSACSLCEGGEPCDAYQPCDETCESGLPCWNELGMIGTCLPVCMGPENCPLYEGFASDCFGDMCLIPCENDCPDGLQCQVTQLAPTPVCLW